MMNLATSVLFGLALARTTQLFPEDDIEIGEMPDVTSDGSPTLASSVPEPVKTQAAWEGPSHCNDGLCVFSNPIYNGGSVLVTTAENGADVIGFWPHEDTTPDPDPFREVQIPGKGLGLVATRDILTGEIILSRTPTLLTHHVGHSGFPRGLLADLYDVAVAKLPADRRAAFERQFGKDHIDRINKNAFKVDLTGDEEGAHQGAYPDISRINHSCRPNLAQSTINTTMYVTAAVDIPAGTELTISYIDVRLLSEERATSLSAGWGFKCECSLCASGAAGLGASDAALAAAKELEDRLDDPAAEGMRADDGARLVEMLRREGLHVVLGKAYARAALNYALFGRPDEAQKWAGIAAEVLEREFGEGDGDAKGMRILAGDPQGHWSWGVLRKGVVREQAAEKHDGGIPEAEVFS